MTTFELPWPEQALWPNRRAHWRKLHAARTAAKTVGYYAALEAATLRPKPETMPLTLEFCPSTNRRFDRDNALAALKGHIDGIAEAFCMDDSRFEPITVSRGPVVAGGCVRVTIGDKP